MCLLINGLLEQVPEPIPLVERASLGTRVKREFIRMFEYLQKEITSKAMVSFMFPEELRK